MAQFYTLEEAARVLGMDPEELKSKAQHREVRAFMDSGSWRFRVADIDELARQRGMGSDPDLSLSDLDLPSSQEKIGAGDSDSEEIDLSEFQLGVAKSDLGPQSMDLPPVDDDSSSGEQDVLLDESSLPQGSQSGSSSTILGMEQSSGKMPSDSDVRLVPDDPKESSDSDVQLSGENPAMTPKTPEPDLIRPSDSDVSLVGESDDSVDAFATMEDSQSREDADSDDPSSGTVLRPSPLGSSGEIKSESQPEGASRDDQDDSSDFELTPSSVIDALQPDSGSDFELSALDGSDEFEATPTPSPKPSDSDVTGAEPSTSGINLGRPSDSGINLQSVGSLDDMENHDSIELAPLDDEDDARPAPPKKPAAKATPKEDLSAATALPTKSEKDIFDDTDFEVDALEGSDEDRTMQLEQASDFDLEESDESASEVFAIDEEDVDEKAATAMAPAVLEDEDDVSIDAESSDDEDALEGSWEEEAADIPAPSSARSSAASPVLASSGSGPEWGGLWVGLLGVTSVFMLLLTFITMDVVRNLNAYQSDTPVASGIVTMIAGE